MKTHNLLTTTLRNLLAITTLAGLASASLGAEVSSRLRVGYNQWIGFAPFFLGQKTGAFKKAGLEVEARAFAAPGEGLVPLLAGDLDLHLTTLDAVVLKSGEAPGKIQVVALIDASHGADALVAAPGIRSVRELRGKRVAVTVGECNEVLLLKALEASGLSEKDIEMVNMDPDAAGTALKAGKVDAAVTWEPWITQIVGDGGHVLFSTKDLPNVLIDCVAINPSTVKPQAVRRFLEVMDAMTREVRSNPAAAAEHIAAQVELPAEEVLDMMGKVVFYDAEDSRRLLEKDIPGIVTLLSDFFVTKGSLRAPVEASSILSAQYLPEP